MAGNVTIFGKYIRKTPKLGWDYVVSRCGDGVQVTKYFGNDVKTEFLDSEEVFRKNYVGLLINDNKWNFEPDTYENVEEFLNWLVGEL